MSIAGHGWLSCAGLKQQMSADSFGVQQMLYCAGQVRQTQAPAESRDNGDMAPDGVMLHVMCNIKGQAAHVRPVYTVRQSG